MFLHQEPPYLESENYLVCKWCNHQNAFFPTVSLVKTRVFDPVNRGNHRVEYGDSTTKLLRSNYTWNTSYLLAKKGVL